MKRVSVSEAKPGMTLARPIADQQGRVIVNAGAQLSPLYISRLPKWGVKELHVEDDAPGPAPAADVLDGMTSSGPITAEPARALPPGIYQGADLPERIGRTFARVQNDPLMAALRQAVARHLCGPGNAGGAASPSAGTGPA